MATSATPETCRRIVRHRRVASFAIPVLYLLGTFFFWQAGGQWWPWQAIGIVFVFAASVWVFDLTSTAAEYEEKRATGRVIPSRPHATSRV